MRASAIRRASAMGSAMAGSVCAMAWAGTNPYSFTPITPPSNLAGQPVTFVGAPNASGQVAGNCGSPSHAFVFTPGGGGAGSVDVHPDPGALVSYVLALNDAGQVLGQACMTGGPCRMFLFRYTPGVGSIRLDQLPGAPPAEQAEYTPLKMNARGSVAVTFDRVSGPLFMTNWIYLFTDAHGWQDLTPLLPAPTTNWTAVVGIDDADRVLIRAGSPQRMYLYTPPDVPGSGLGTMQQVLGDANALDMNASGQVAGLAVLGGATRIFRGNLDGTIHNLNPAIGFTGPFDVQIAESGIIVGAWDYGFFSAPASGLAADLGIVPWTQDAAYTGTTVSTPNIRGEFTGEQLDEINYDTLSVIKLAGQPLRSVQEEIDPAVERIHVTGATAMNDAGQFAVVGRMPGTATSLSLLVSPQFCRADFNGNGAISVEDIFSFLAAYFAGDLRADYDDSTVLTVNDLFRFLALYFTGCTN